VAQALDASERRARGRRLIIICSFIAVLLIGGLVWRRATDRAVSSKADSAMVELRRAWRVVDLDDLQRQYSVATTAANDTGDDGRAVALFPQPRDAELFVGTFVRGGVFEASYNVSAGWGGHRCVQMRVVGPAPNRIAFQEHGGEC
jgi:hypothetical protein